MKILAFFCFHVILHGSVYLYNDSPFVLRAEVIAASGVKMGEKEMQPQGLHYMEDQLGQSDPVNHQEQPFNNYKDSLTPYKVYWYCQNGGVYGVCEDTAAGATVMATTCSGSHNCISEKKAEEKPQEETGLEDNEDLS